MSVRPARSQSIVVQLPENEDRGKGSCPDATSLQGAATANLVQPRVVFFALVAGLVLLAIVSATMKESGGGKALVGFIMAIAGLVFAVVAVQFGLRYREMKGRLEGKEDKKGNRAKAYNVQDYYSDSMKQRGAMIEMMGAVILVVAGGAAFSQMQ